MASQPDKRTAMNQSLRRVRDESRRLKHAFDRANAKGMAALRRRDVDAVAEAIEEEGAIIDEQTTLLKSARMNPAKSPKGSK
jgi:hypothetical protein